MMKKIALLALVAASTLMADLEWAKSFGAAKEQAAKEKKMVMVMLSREGCPACEYMRDIVFDTDTLVEELQASFVPVYIDIHNDFVPSGLGYIGTPTFHFLTAEGNKRGRLDGAANVPDFTAAMREAKSKGL